MGMERRMSGPWTRLGHALETLCLAGNGSWCCGSIAPDILALKS